MTRSLQAALRFFLALSGLLLAGFGFAVLGLVLGSIGFWGAPYLFQTALAYREALFGPTVFLFVFWIFINVHHYFLDNVMWRSQNPDVRAHLFR